MKNGVGIFIFSNGDILNDVANGIGSYTIKESGKIIFGEWVDNLLEE